VIGPLFFLVFIASHLYPFSLSQSPLGYDTGIYRYELWSSIQALPEYVSGLFLGLPLITDVFGLFGMPADSLISALYLLALLLVPLSMMMLAKRKWGNAEALLVLLFFTISLIQWKAYTMLLYKQIFALALIFFSFFLLHRRSYLLVIPLGFMALLQPLDAFLVGASIAVFALLSIFLFKEDRKFFLHLFVTGLAGGFILLLVDPSFWSRAWDIFYQGIADVGELEFSLQQGTFLSLADYGYQSALFFVFGMIGVLLELKSKRPTAMTIYFFLLLLWIALRFFFYQRLLIQFDAVLLFLRWFCRAAVRSSFCTRFVWEGLDTALAVGNDPSL